MSGGNTSSPPQQQQPTVSPNTLFTTSIADCVFMLGEGPIPAPADIYRAVYLNGVPIKSADGTFNFNNVYADLRLGYPDQVFFSGIKSASSVAAVELQVHFAAPIVRQISDTSATSAQVTIRIPALQFIRPSTGDILPGTVQYHIDVQPNGGAYATVVADSITGKCTSPVEFDYDIPLTPGEGPWNIRVVRDTGEPSQYFQGDTWWAELTTIRDYRLAYPNTAVLRLRIDATQFSGSFPTVEYQGQFLILQIPSNYNPTTRQYTGIWDGTFTTGFTDNPAWVLWNIITNSRWGLGRWILPAAVDKWTLYAASQWFDQLVPDGMGGLEPRYRFNGTIDSAVKAFDAITTICGACQMMPYFTAGSVFFNIDQPGTPVKQIGYGNVIDGKIMYQGTDLASRATSVQVTWSDPTNNYQTAIEACEDPNNISTFGLRVNQIAAALCTSQGQARRHGLYELYTAWTETNTATFSIGAAEQDLVPGNLIDITDPIIQERQMFGRVLDISGTQVTLDRPVSLDNGATYQLRIVGTDNQLHTFNVTDQANPAISVLDVDSPPTALTGSVWQLISSNLTPRRFRVLTVDEKDGSFTITAALHNPNKQALVEGGVVVNLPPITGYPRGPLAAPSGLAVSQATVQLLSGTWVVRTFLGWTLVPDPRVAQYEIGYRQTGDTVFIGAGTTQGVTWTSDELRPGSYEFRVRAIGFLNEFSPWSTTLAQQLIDLNGPPPDVTGLTIQALDSSINLSWNAINIPNLAYYEVRFSSDVNNTTWQAMIPAATQITATGANVPAFSGVYGVKAYTAQGNQSVNPALVVTNTSGLNINIVQTLDATSTFNGVFVNTTLDPIKRIVLAPVTPDLFSVSDFFSLPFSDLLGWTVQSAGSFTFNNIIDLGQSYKTRVSANLTVTGVRTTDDIWNQLDVWSLADVWGSNPSGWDAWVEVMSTTDDPNVNPRWTPWTRLIASDIQARAFQGRFQLSSTDSYVTPALNGQIIFDMPDSLRSGAHIPVAQTGTVVSFTPPFYGPARPALVITGLEGAQTADYADVQNITQNGFLIYIRSSGGVAQSGRYIDYHAKGWG